MTNKSTPPSALQDQLRELEDEAEKKKIRLTPEVKKYIREHLEAVQEKLVKGESVLVSDMAFMDEVKLWMTMPAEWREKYASIEEMKGAEEMRGVTMADFIEANKRGITLKQWFDLLHVAEAKKTTKSWIDEQFIFPGGGKILVGGDLNLGGCTGLTALPEGLRVGGDLDLLDCTGLQKNKDKVLSWLFEKVKQNEINGFSLSGWPLTDGDLPEWLRVEGNLSLNGCTGLTALPEGLGVGGDLVLNDCTGLTVLPEGLGVGRDLHLIGCTSLTTLPAGLEVGGNLDLSRCTGLTALPEGLRVGGNLFLGRCTSQVKKDAERLKKEGRIKANISYS